MTSPSSLSPLGEKAPEIVLQGDPQPDSPVEGSPVTRSKLLQEWKIKMHNGTVPPYYTYKEGPPCKKVCELIEAIQRDRTFDVHENMELLIILSMSLVRFYRQPANFERITDIEGYKREIFSGQTQDFSVQQQVPSVEQSLEQLALCSRRALNLDLICSPYIRSDVLVFPVCSLTDNKRPYRVFVDLVRKTAQRSHDAEEGNGSCGFGVFTVPFKSEDSSASSLSLEESLHARDGIRRDSPLKEEDDPS